MSLYFHIFDLLSYNVKLVKVLAQYLIIFHFKSHNCDLKLT